MYDSEWLKNQKTKNSKVAWIVLSLVAVGIIALLFVINSSSLLSHIESKNSATVSSSEKQDQPTISGVSNNESPKVAVHNTTEAVVKNDDREKKQQEQKNVADSVAVNTIICRLADRSKPFVRLSVMISFAVNGALKNEILLKRDNIKVIVQKIMSGKSMKEIAVDSIRADIKNGCNALLENGAVSDVGFTDFRIDKVE